MAGKQSGHGGSIKVTVEPDNVAVITMDRGENRMNDEFIDQMNAALDDVLRYPSLKAVVVTGDGKFFSNGLDLGWLNELNKTDRQHLKQFLNRMKDLQIRLLVFPLLTVAAINGHAYAGGALLSLFCDCRVMQTDRGWWCINEAHLGMRIIAWQIAVLQLKLNGKSLTDVALYGRRFAAQEAKAAGIIDEVSSAEELVSAAKALVDRLPTSGQINRSFVSGTKKSLYADVFAVMDKRMNLSSLTSAL